MYATDATAANCAAMGFPSDYFPVLFAIPRVAGWLAHWVESLTAGLDGVPRIWRPRQVYVGPVRRAYVPLEARAAQKIGVVPDLSVPHHAFNRRFLVSKQ